jgi:hypothetical protein
MRTIIKILILFLLITGLSTVLMNFFDVHYGNTDFWTIHGFFFLVFISIFPRLTLLFSSVAFGGIFWWLGFFFAPRMLVAILATVSYWNTNKVLVIISWLMAIGGESSEKYFIHRRTFRRRNIEPKIGVIDAEYYEIKD